LIAAFGLFCLSVAFSIVKELAVSIMDRLKRQSQRVEKRRLRLPKEEEGSVGTTLD
jgi:hypothetical protein